jgi:hypothetical protein
MGRRHNASPQTCLIPVMAQDRNPSCRIFSHVVLLKRLNPAGYSSNDSHVSHHLLDHRIQPSAQHLLGDTESESLDRVQG